VNRAICLYNLGIDRERDVSVFEELGRRLIVEDGPSLFRAIKTGNWGECLVLIEEGRGIGYMSVLHEAILKLAPYFIIEALLRRGLDVNDGCENQYPLDLVVRSSYERGCFVLLTCLVTLALAFA
jgi:hypothetical protein